MNIIIKENGSREELNLIDPSSGIDCIQDFIGNTGALPRQFSYDEDENAYVCNQDTFDWWHAVVEDNQALMDRMDKLKEEHGSEAVEAAISDLVGGDLEDTARFCLARLNDVFGE